jgi:hypothetical protein
MPRQVRLSDGRRLKPTDEGPGQAAVALAYGVLTVAALRLLVWILMILGGE